MTAPPGRQPAPLALEVIAMSKRFGPLVALDAVSMRVRTGSFHALLGENGAGKSTLVKCIVGYYRPDDGDLLIDDYERSRSSSSSTSSGGYYCSMDRRQC
jgi:simple sugar transport system ATP-binding protein